MVRAKPVVKSLTVDAGTIGASGRTLQSRRPLPSAMAIPQSPGA